MHDHFDRYQNPLMRTLKALRERVQGIFWKTKRWFSMTSLREKLSRQPPPVLYKYRSWDNKLHQSLLRDNKIFFASPQAFNDPFDCRIPIRCDLLTEKQKYELYLEAARGRWPDRPEEEIAREAEELRRGARFDDPVMLSQLQQKWENILLGWGVFSLSEDPTSILMWSHYADCHRGFCVGFKTAEWDVEERRWEQQGIQTHGHPVIYEDKYPTILPDNSRNNYDIKQVLLTKSELWAYEKEWRALLFFQTNKPLCIRDAVFSEVILGCQMPPEYKSQVVEVVRGKSSSIRIRQAVKKEGEFALDLVDWLDSGGQDLQVTR
jgi:hypothetical protein